MKILGIRKLYADTDRLRCTLVTDLIDIQPTIEVDFHSSEGVNLKVMDIITELSDRLIKLIEKEILK